MFKILLISFCLVLNTLEGLARKSPTFDELLTNKDLSSFIEDYQIEEDDLSLQEIPRGLGFPMGNQSDSSATAKTGNVTSSGSRKNNSFKSGLKGSHDARDQQGFYNLGGAHSLGTVDDADFYAQRDAIENNSQGEDVQEQKNYRRGSKSRGYHRIHRKDDFKNDRLFYDDRESSGTLRKFGGKGAATRSGVGGRVHKGRFHHDLQKGVFGKQGSFDKGSLDKQLEAFANAQGFEGSFNDNQQSGISDGGKVESDFSF